MLTDYWACIYDKDPKAMEAIEDHDFDPAALEAELMGTAPGAAADDDWEELN